MFLVESIIPVFKKNNYIIAENWIKYYYYKPELKLRTYDGLTEREYMTNNKFTNYKITFSFRLFGHYFSFWMLSAYFYSVQQKSSKI